MRHKRWAIPGVKPIYKGYWPLGKGADYEFAYDAEAERLARAHRWKKRVEKKNALLS